MAEHRDTVTLDGDELEDGDRLFVEVDGRDIAVFNVDGEYYAYNNFCPHQAGPVCEGRISGTRAASFDRSDLEVSLEWEREGNICNCPWHGWEFDVTTGECLTDANARLIEYPVREEDGEIVVELG